jgi:hypothetical protein
VVGFIGMSSPSSIYAQYYDDYQTEYSQYYDDYEKSYEKYMKDDYSKISIQKISCNNIINPLRTNDVNTGNEPEATSSNKVNSFNPDRFSGQKGNFLGRMSD